MRRSEARECRQVRWQRSTMSARDSCCATHMRATVRIVVLPVRKRLWEWTMTEPRKGALAV